MPSEKMIAEKEGAVGRLIFNNPARRNAVSLDMWQATGEILKDFAADDAIRVVILSGAGGKAFVSGADISEFEDKRNSEEAIAAYEKISKGAHAALAEIDKPTIAMIDGFCVGGGLALAATCDLRFCSEKSIFALPAARLGLGYPFPGIKRLVDLVGPGATCDITFSARKITASEAYDMGLVQKVLPEDALADFVADYARQVAANAPLTVKSMKVIVNEALKDERDRDLAQCQALVDQAFASSDYIEGRRAFMEKRPPKFEGR